MRGMLSDEAGNIPERIMPPPGGRGTQPARIESVPTGYLHAGPLCLGCSAVMLSTPIR